MPRSIYDDINASIHDVHQSISHNVISSFPPILYYNKSVVYNQLGESYK